MFYRDIPNAAAPCQNDHALSVVMQSAEGQRGNCFLCLTLHLSICSMRRQRLCVQMVLLVDSLRLTGCGDAFAQLKVHNTLI